MRFLWFFLLTGCSLDAVIAEHRLNTYAAVAQNGELNKVLTGSALESAIQSRELVRELGLKSVGASEFSGTWSLSEQRFVSCLDVSGTSFFSATGEPVVLDRILRQEVLVSFEGDKVSEFELTGSKC